MSTALTQWDGMMHAIAVAHTIDEVKDIRDRAEALRQYARQANEGLEAQNQLAEIKIRAERRAGEILKETDKAKPSGSNQYEDVSHDATHPPTLAEMGISRDQSSRWQRIAAIPEEAFERKIVEDKAEERELTSAGMLRLSKDVEAGRTDQAMTATTYSHKSLEYYTPVEYLDAAREVMGGIDLDPATCEAAQANVQATKFYTKEDDGFSQPWHGRVWLNPPYSKTDGRSNQEMWSSRLVEEYENGNVTEAILLVKAALGYKWFEALWLDRWVCLARDRLSFILENGDDEGQSKQGTAFVYFGEDAETFCRVFSKFGRIIPTEAVINDLLGY